MIENENFEFTDGSGSQSGKPRVMFVSQACYFDTYGGASVATRSLMEWLARRGFPASAMTGTVLETGEELDPAYCLADQGLTPELFHGLASATSTAAPVRTASPLYRLAVADVQVVLHRSPTSQPQALEEPVIAGFAGLLECVLDEFRPDVLINFADDSLPPEIRRRARARGIAVVAAFHDFNYRSRDVVQDGDAAIVPSQFAASYYRRILDLSCEVLPWPISIDRSRALSRDPRYVTFVNPSFEKGVFAFADRRRAWTSATRYPTARGRRERDRANAGRLRPRPENAR